jgi:hypothetical protein
MMSVVLSCFLGLALNAVTFMVLCFGGVVIWFFHDGYCGLLVDYGVWRHGVYMVYLGSVCELLSLRGESFGRYCK